MDGPHATNLEMGIPGGRAASHGGEGNRRVAREREGHETSGGVDDCGTNTKDGTATWEIRDLSAMGRVRRSATSQSERKADGKRKSEGPIRAMTTGNGDRTRTRKSKGAPVRG